MSHLADASFVMSRGSIFDATYVIYNTVVKFGAFALVGLIAYALRGGVIVALALCVGLEGLAYRGPLVGATMLAGCAAGLFARRHLLPADRPESPMTAGVVVGLAISLTLILGMRLPVLSTFLGDQRLSTAVSTSLLILAALIAFGVYESLRARIRQSLPRLPASEWVVAVALVTLFLALPLSFGSNRETLAPELRGGDSTSDKPHVFVLVLDTVRADRLAIYGNERDTTPRLAARLSEHPNAVALPLAISPSSWTTPSHASLFSGLYPFEHGVTGGGVKTFSYGSLPDSPTLAETMKQAGYLTAGLYANPLILRIGGGERGYDVHAFLAGVRVWHLFPERVRARWFKGFARSTKLAADGVNEAVLRFLDECGAGPCFVVANYMDAHAPLLPRPPHAGMFSGGDDGRAPWQRGHTTLDRYDEAIRGLDEHIDELFVALDERGMLDRSWVFITADHGESFEEHVGRGHGVSLYNEEIRIPLVVFPALGVAPLPLTNEPVSLVDITQTVSAIAGGPPLGSGRDLRQPPSGPTPIWSELHSSTEPRLQRTVLLGQAKLLDRGSEGRELYRLDVDPHERNDRSKREPDRTARLASLLQDAQRAPQPTGDVLPPPTPEEEAALRALGYVD